MLLSELDVSRLRELPYRSAAKDRAAKAGLTLIRRVYDTGELIVKLWPVDWRGWNLVVDGNRRRRFHRERDGAATRLPGDALGIYDARTTPAFADYVYADTGELVGYATRRGIVVNREEMDSAADCVALVDLLIERSLATGHILRDVHAGNIIRLPDGRVSLIDLETPLARLATLDLNHEVETGALRRGTSQRYRQFIFDLVDRRQSTGGKGDKAAPEAPAATASSPEMAWIAEVEQELARL